LVFILNCKYIISLYNFYTLSSISACQISFFVSKYFRSIGEWSPAIFNFTGGKSEHQKKRMVPNGNGFEELKPKVRTVPQRQLKLRFSAAKGEKPPIFGGAPLQKEVRGKPHPVQGGMEKSEYALFFKPDFYRRTNLTATLRLDR
jgi:hypothetical protein